MKRLLILLFFFVFAVCKSQIGRPPFSTAPVSVSGFPQILTGTQQGGRTSAGTSSTITMPDGVEVGDLLVVCFAADANAAQTVTINAGSNWTIASQVTNATNNVTGAVVWKIAEGGDALTLGHNNEETSHISYRISGFDAEDPIKVTNASGNATTDWDPPSNTGDNGAVDYIWIAFIGSDDPGVASAGPTDFSGLVTQAGDGAGSASCSVATREYNTGDAYDPDAFTRAGAATAWSGFTIIINPE